MIILSIDGTGLVPGVTLSLVDKAGSFGESGLDRCGPRKAPRQKRPDDVADVLGQLIHVRATGCTGEKPPYSVWLAILGSGVLRANYSVDKSKDGNSHHAAGGGQFRPYCDPEERVGNMDCKVRQRSREGVHGNHPPESQPQVRQICRRAVGRRENAGGGNNRVRRRW
ncbi:MAG: hypothetical protein ACREFQ_11605 [Stellaceae bacterium]